MKTSSIYEKGSSMQNKQFIFLCILNLYILAALLWSWKLVHLLLYYPIVVAIYKLLTFKALTIQKGTRFLSSCWYRLPKIIRYSLLLFSVWLFFINSTSTLIFGALLSAGSVRKISKLDRQVSISVHSRIEDNTSIKDNKSRRVCSGEFSINSQSNRNACINDSGHVSGHTLDHDAMLKRIEEIHQIATQSSSVNFDSPNNSSNK